METRSHIVLVFAVVVGMFAALLGFVWWITPSDGTRGPRYDILFAQSVAGLVEGSPVSFAGVPVGRVQSIGLHPNDPGLVRVRIAITEDTLTIHQGTQATLKTSLAFGSSLIDLEAPDQAGAVIPLDDEGVGLIPAKKPGLGELAGDPAPMLERISRGTDMMLELTSPEGQKAITAKLDASVQSTAELARRSAMLDGRIARTRGAIRATGTAATQFADLADARGRQLQANGRAGIRQLRAQSAAARESLKALDARVEAAGAQIGTFSQSAADLGASARDMRGQVAKVQAGVDSVESGSLTGPALPDYKPD